MTRVEVKTNCNSNSRIVTQLSVNHIRREKPNEAITVRALEIPPNE